MRLRFWFGYWWPSWLIGWPVRATLRAPHPRGVRCLGVLLPEHIGDVVLTSPLLRALRGHFPEAEIIAAISPEAAPLLTPCPFVQRVLVWPKGRRAAWRMGWALRRLAPDMVVVPRADPDQRWAPLVAVLSGAPRRISLTDALTTGGRLKRLQAEPFFSETVQVSLGVLHESARRLEIARRLGVNTPDRRLETWVNQSDEARAEAFVTSLPTGPRIAIGLGASAAVRTWPVERFGKLLDRLSAGGVVVPVIIVGPHEMALVEALRAACRVPVYCLAGATLGASIAILRRCTLFIGNDSGPMHLACSVALPVVEISAHPVGASDRHPNSPEKCGPVGAATKVVRPLLPASDSCSGGCQQLAAHCILGVGVEDVVAAIEALGVLPRDSNREACR